MRILVIGGTRFIGLALVERLVELRHDVAVLNRGISAAVLPASVERITGDREDLGACRRAMQQFAPDVVLHNMVSSAAHAQELLEVVAGIVPRVVMTSSMDVYRPYGRGHGLEGGAADHAPQHELSPRRKVLFPYRGKAEDENDPRYHYDKIPAEDLVLASEEPQGTVLRLPMVLGPNDYQHRLYPILRPMLDARSVIVMEDEYADWRSTYGYVDNVTDAMALACTSEQAAQRVYNVGDWTLSLRELVGLVAMCVGWSGDLVTAAREALPSELAQDWGVEHWLVVASRLIEEELGHVGRVGLEDAVTRTIAWERSNPPDPVPPEMLPYEAEDAFLSDNPDATSSSSPCAS